MTIIVTVDGYLNVYLWQFIIGINIWLLRVGGGELRWNIKPLSLKRRYPVFYSLMNHSEVVFMFSASAVVKFITHT